MEKEDNKMQKIILPLYSYKKGKEKIINKKSGLNQWNAKGRLRHNDEVYIPFPSELREKFKNFFPDRKYPFKVKLPNGEILNMKVCQQGGKAIMSNPNKDLGKWILRDVLKIPEKKVVKYKDLLEIGIDSVVFEKFDNFYKLDFQKIGSYEFFIQNFVLDDYNDLNKDF
ncbi:hypothetical protein LT335_00632 [Spiroplasma sp. JKS002669]|uniref:hypothetical protein n=1 Tax=Spiroplasma attinicola TaxID=2904537 RepID=UPI0020C10524|nr:hypothetical protein [Spiroplasma sp. JKS002669]MCL6429070.1 hypothetical protein [Spiroplasma sp. JKS002669]